jgi:hypothetical protein
MKLGSGGGGGVEAYRTVRSRCGFKSQRVRFYFEETEDEEITCMPPQCTWKKQTRKKTKMKRQMWKKMKMKMQNEDEAGGTYFLEKVPHLGNLKGLTRGVLELVFP